MEKINGMRIVALDYLFEKSTGIPKRKHKKKRIQKKWIKRYGFKKEIDDRIITIFGVAYCHSKTLKYLKKKL